MNTPPLSVVMIGATGAVGSNTLQALLTYSQVDKITVLGPLWIFDKNSCNKGLVRNFI